MMCGSSGTCVSSLRCFGTDGGKCYENDRFIGRIPGRISAGILDKGTKGAFSITSSVKDSYMSWNDTDRAMELITMINETVIQGSLTKGQDDFTAYMKRKIKKTTEALNEGNANTANTAGNNTTAGTGAGQGANSNSQMPEEDLMIKLKFEKQ